MTDEWREFFAKSEAKRRLGNDTCQHSFHFFSLLCKILILMLLFAMLYTCIMHRETAGQEEREKVDDHGVGCDGIERVMSNLLKVSS